MQFTAQDRNRLLDAISDAQECYIAGAGAERLFPRLLDHFLDLTSSASGYIGIVRRQADGRHIVKVHTVAEAPGGQDRHGARSRRVDSEFEPDNPDTLIGAVLAQGEPVISNVPAGNPRDLGLPGNHPPINSFMGLPILRRDEPVGLIGVANRAAGYDEEIATFLKPLLRTCGQLMEALEFDNAAARLKSEVAEHSRQLEAELAERTRTIAAREARLGQSETRYRTLFELSPDAVVTIQDGRFVDCNQAALRLFDLNTKEALRAAQPGDFSPPGQPDGQESVAAARQHFRTAAESGSASFEWTYRSRNGREFPAEVFLQSMNIGGSVLLQAVIRDVSQRKAMEGRARIHRDYLEAVLEDSPAAIMVTHIDSGQIRFANRSASKMLRMDDAGAEDLSANNLWVQAEDRERFIGQLKRHGVARGEARLRKADGTILYAHLNWQYNPGNSDEVLCWALDISDQKDVQHRLHYQERMLQQIVDHLPVALFCKDVNDDFRYTMANRKCEEFFGAPAEAVIGRTDFEIFPDHVALRFREQDLEIAATGTLLEIPEEQIEPATGDTVYGHVIKIAIPDHQGEPSLLVGICENVTERREAEKALHASERRFRELTEHAPVGIYLTDPRGACIYVNEQWQLTTGLDQQQAAGDGWLSAVHADDRESVLTGWRAFIDESAPFSLEFRFLRPTGEEVWVASNAVAFKNEDGQTVGFLGTMTDITQRKLFESQLKISRDEAQRANQAKSEFLSRMSHELRTPLNAILGFGQLLQLNGENLSENQQEGVEQILAGGEHLLELIDDVLDFSRMDTGHMSLSIQRVDTAERLNAALSLVGPMAQRSGVEIKPPVDHPPDVIADSRRLHQILVNLLTNAIKYNRRGGEVSVLHERLDDDMVRIAVQDNGRGIHMEDGERLFEPFERAVDPNRLVEGTGIGLSICKRLVEMMGGRIGFDSEFGTGSTFWIDLPAAEATEGGDSRLDSELGLTAEFAELEGIRILYVEDHLASIRFMSEIARRLAGCELLTATNATAGIALAKSARPDLILMDINLPGMNGIEALEVLLSDERTAGIPVVALSASASANAIQAGLAAGFVRFLPKPLRLGQLFGTIAAIRREARSVRNKG
jgi:PAS domain S-box-containing protein